MSYVGSNTWGLFNDFLDVADLLAAEGLLNTPSEWSRIMKRVCFYSAIGMNGPVSKAEPRRAAFNATLLKYETLQRACTIKLLRTVMPAQSMLVEPAIEKALVKFHKFSECTTVKMRVLFKEIATTILQIPTSELESWGYAQVQQGLKALLTLIGHGPLPLGFSLIN